VSVHDREQLIRQIAEETHNEDNIGAGTIVCWHCHSAARAAVDALDRLGYSVIPAESPAEAPRIASAAPEGSEATHTAERRPDLEVPAAECRCKPKPRSGEAHSILCRSQFKTRHGLWRAVAVETEETPT
jgi:hypothetical protein